MSQKPELHYPTYTAIALQPKLVGCRNRDDIKRNMQNQLNLIDDSFINGHLPGPKPVKLIVLAEGAIQGFYDELHHLDHATYCRDLALRVPGEETEMLAAKAREHDIYIAFQAKIVDPDVAEDRWFNMGFIISPRGEIILRHPKNVISIVEGSASPYDLWDKWSAKYGDSLEAHYPVAKTDIGNLGMCICAETSFPESYRALTVNGAEVIIKMTFVEPTISWGIWEATNITHAFWNLCYLVCPNGGPYYDTFERETSFELCGGNSMIVDYMGHVITKAAHSNVTGIPGCIDIRALREHRDGAPQAVHSVQMRSSLWKKIYDKWPEYPKNLYVEQDYPHMMERYLMHLDLLEKYYDVGIFERPEE